MTELPLPAPYAFGRVVGRMIEAVGDISAADDPYPDMKPVAGPGTVRFTPVESARLLPGAAGEPTIKARHRKIVADLDADRAISGARGGGVVGD